MQLIDNTMYDPKYTEFQDLQQAQVAACRDFYREVNVDRMTVLEYDEVEEPLEKTRLYGPFPLDVVRWVQMCPFVRLFVDSDGREVVEY